MRFNHLLPHKKSIIQLDRDAMGLFLPAILGVLVLLATLLFVLSHNLSNNVQNWRTELEGHASVQVMPLERGASIEDRVQQVLKLAEKSPAVATARPLDEAEMAKLLSPWLGDNDLAKELPIPALIDLRLSGKQSAFIALEHQLEAIEGVEVDNHSAWVNDLRHLSNVSIGVIYTLLGLIIMASLLILILLIKATMAAHHDVIELLHLVGATDDFIIRQLQRHMIFISALGAALGLVAATLLLWLLQKMAHSAGLTLDINLLLLLIMPVLFISLSALTARKVVQRQLLDLH